MLQRRKKGRAVRKGCDARDKKDIHIIEILEDFLGVRQPA
jgi:hypothetical protein